MTAMIWSASGKSPWSSLKEDPAVLAFCKVIFGDAYGSVELFRFSSIQPIARLSNGRLCVLLNYSFQFVPSAVQLCQYHETIHYHVMSCWRREQ